MSTDQSFQKFHARNTVGNLAMVFSTFATSLAYSFYASQTMGSLAFAPIAITSLLSGIAAFEDEGRVGVRDYDNTIPSEMKANLEEFLNKAGYNKSIRVFLYDDIRDEDIAKAVQGQIHINEARFYQLDECGQRRVLAHEVSHLVNRDGTLGNVNKYIGKVSSSLLTVPAIAMVLDKPALVAIGATCLAVQRVIAKKLSRNVECRADVQGAYWAGQNATDLQKSFDNVRRLFGEVNLGGYPTRKSVIRIAEHVLR